MEADFCGLNVDISCTPKHGESEYGMLPKHKLPCICAQI